MMWLEDHREIKKAKPQLLITQTADCVQSSPGREHALNLEIRLTLCPGPCFCPVDRDCGELQSLRQEAAAAEDPPERGHTAERRT